jgi:hypothetical protein
LDLGVLESTALGECAAAIGLPVDAALPKTLAASLPSEKLSLSI